MEFDAVFTVKKEISKEDFLRGILIRLGTHPETPVDVVNTSFGRVNESIKEVIVCTASVEGICNASVGYDRQEPYTDYETYKEKVGDTYVTRQRDVTKYRTVTDWRPFNTQYSGKATCAAFNDHTGTSDDDIIDAIKTANPDSIVPKGEAEVCVEGLRKAVSICETNVEIESVTFPGDHHKDVRFNSDSTIESISCYKLPHYDVQFSYKGKQFNASCFASGNLIIDCDIPENDINIEAEVQSLTKDAEKKKKIAWWAFIGSFAFSAIMCFGVKICWLWFLPLAALVAAIFLHSKYNKEYENCSRELTTNISNTKINELNKALRENGFDELNSFEAGRAQVNSIPSIKKPKSFKTRAIWCSILTGILIVASLINGSIVSRNNLHSPKQLNIAISGISHEYKENVSSYINGCYYIYINFDVEAKKTGIDYINLKVHVRDKSGNEIGVLKTSLEGLNIDSGSRKTIKSTWSENQPDKNAFFSKLYNAKFENLEFTYEIGSIQFTDGQYYFNRDYNEFS